MKKKIITTFIFALAVGILNNAFAQRPIDDGIRSRSAELERIKRQAESDTKVELQNGRVIDIAKVKKDFEGIQKLQDSIVEAYTKGEKIDYKKINSASGQMTKMADRLRTVLFLLAGQKTVSNKQAEKPENTQDLRDLIIGLDDAIGRFVSSPIFQDIRIVQAEVLEKSLSDLEEISDLSQMIWLESNKLKQ